MATIVDCNLMAPFSIATTPKCKGGHNCFSYISPFCPWYIPYKQGGVKYHFLSLCNDLTWDWTPVSRAIGKHSTHEANGVVYIYIYIYIYIYGFFKVYQGGIKYFFLSLWYGSTWGWTPGPLANTLFIRPMAWFVLNVYK